MAPQGRSAPAWWVLFLALLVLAGVFYAVLRLQNRYVPEPLVLAGAGFFVVAAIALVRKTRRRWVTAALGLALAAIATVVWVMPVVAGPRLECVDTDQAICDAVLRGYQDNDGGLLPGTGWEQFFPVTRVRVWDGGCQGSVERAWGLFFPMTWTC